MALWFEPERLARGSSWAEEHPEWLLHVRDESAVLFPLATDEPDRNVGWVVGESCRTELNPGDALVNLGEPGAWAWVTDFISERITRWGIDVYRHDFNFAPLQFWREHDSPDRAGVTEMKYVEGLYAFFDALLARHPGLQIDNCAGGGRHIDVEMMQRSVPLARSDYFFDPVGHQCQTYGLSFWVPCHAAIAHTGHSRYALLSATTSGLSSSWCNEFNEREYDPVGMNAEEVRSLLAECVSLRRYFLGDFYPLTGYTTSHRAWLAYQWHRPEPGDGVAVAFRRPECQQETLNLPLRGWSTARCTTSISTGKGRSCPGLNSPTGWSSGARTSLACASSDTSGLTEPMETNVSEDRRIFGIGEPGSGPNQFGPDWGQAEPPVRSFRTGVDQAAVAWPAFQPGPLDAYHGWRSHRIDVEFEVPSDRSGSGSPVETYELLLSFFASHGPCPDIEIGIGGHLGTFRPDVVREDRSEVFRQSAIAGHVQLDVRLLATWFRDGANLLSVGTVLGDDYRRGHDRHDGRPMSDEVGHPFYGSWFGSGITWDSVVLRPAGTGSGAHRATRLECSPRYRQGQPLRQVLRLSTALRRPEREATTATVAVGDFVEEVVLAHDGRDFGELGATLTVPEVEAPTPATVTIDGETTHHLLTPGRKWTVHLVPHVHLDLGFTDYQGKVLELHSRNLERAVEALARDPGFKFTIDGSSIVSDFLATRSADAIEPVIAALRANALGVNAFHSLFLAGLASLEECFRATYNTAALRSAYQVRSDVAHLTDVPSYPISLPSVLAHLGIEAFAGIVNHARAATRDSDLAHLWSPVMWEGVDGSRILTYFVDSYSQLRFLASRPADNRGGRTRP